jgi:hypothetical protein
MTDQAYDKRLDAAIHAWARARWLERSAVLPSQLCSASDEPPDDTASGQNVVHFRPAAIYRKRCLDPTFCYDRWRAIVLISE